MSKKIRLVEQLILKHPSMSTKDLAEMAGVSSSYVSQIRGFHQFKNAGSGIDHAFMQLRRDEAISRGVEPQVLDTAILTLVYEHKMVDAVLDGVYPKQMKG